MTVIYGDNMELHKKKCIPCEGNTPPLEPEKIDNLMLEIDGSWEVLNYHHLKREFQFEDFQKALDFVNIVGEICENSGHHANFELGWGFVIVLIWTHKIDGLTESDFILASIIDQSVMG
jgi:4a-hydroxytetrahydrobiopterin dehydratase